MNENKNTMASAFTAAMNLELIENRDLIYEEGNWLITELSNADFLVIRKDTSVCRAGGISSFFRGYNIVQYKHPETDLNIDILYRLFAYAQFYKANGKTVDAIKADDITISAIQRCKPVELFRYLENHEYTVSNPFMGIYHITGKAIFPVQIIVTEELDEENLRWLSVLSDRMKDPSLKMENLSLPWDT